MKRVAGDVAHADEPELRVEPASVVRVTPRAERDVAILAWKALAIVGVVFHHTQNRRLDPLAGELVSRLIAAFSFCVLLFLAISGWLHALSQARRPTSVAAFARTRLSRLLIPFIALVCGYAAIWQAIQRAGLLQLNGRLPDSYLGKVASSLWPIDERAVAEQLYYLPLLCLISLGVHALLRAAGRSAIALSCAAALIAGTLWFAQSRPGGFNLGGAVWGWFAYACGFLLYERRSLPQLGWLGLAFGLSLIGVLGWAGVPRALPVVLLCTVQARPLRNVAWVSAIGEAAGTVFVYHTPFLLQPLMILVAKLPDWRSQLLGVLLAAATALGLTVTLHHKLKHTRLRFLLL